MQETIVLDGVTYLMWYQNLQQRQMALDEYRQRKYGVMKLEGDRRRQHFGVMAEGQEPNHFGMQ